MGKMGMSKSLADLSSRWFGRQPVELSEAENRVLRSAIDRRVITRQHVHAETLGGRVADAIAQAGGSWTFILSFLAFLAVWTLGNALLLRQDGFDPYPFIFLNLVLSMLAALQAPIIMMSQNRQAVRDRRAAEHDYAVNLKAEIEIMALHEKLDELRQREMIELRNEIAEMRAVLQDVAGGGSASRSSKPETP